MSANDWRQPKPAPRYCTCMCPIVENIPMFGPDANQCGRCLRKLRESREPGS